RRARFGIRRATQALERETRRIRALGHFVLALYQVGAVLRVFGAILSRFGAARRLAGVTFVVQREAARVGFRLSAVRRCRAACPGGRDVGREFEVLVLSPWVRLLDDLDFAAVFDADLLKLEVLRVRGEARPGRARLPHLLREGEAFAFQAQRFRQVDSHLI